jgi:DnaJ-class molecular chaperone
MIKSEINPRDPFTQDRKYCKCCGGSGVQRNKQTGMNQECPCCHGTGKGKDGKRPFYIHPIIWGVS